MTEVNFTQLDRDIEKLEKHIEELSSNLENALMALDDVKKMAFYLRKQSEQSTNNEVKYE